MFETEPPAAAAGASGARPACGDRGGSVQVDGSGDFTDISGVVLALLLAPVLADLAAVPDSVTGDAQLVDVATGLARLEAWAVAERARVAAELVSRTHRDLVRHGMAEHADARGTTAGASHGFDDQRLAARAVSTDLSLALGVTPWAADRELDLAQGLAEHPNLGRALADGRLDRRRTELVLDETAHLSDPAQRATVVSAVVGDGIHQAADPSAVEVRAALIRPLKTPGSHLLHLQPATLRRAVRDQCAALDPEAFTRAAIRAQAGRRVEFAPLPHGMGELRLVAPGYAIAAAQTNIDLTARAARSRGDARTLDQLRCDVTLGWVTEGAVGTLVVRPTTTTTKTTGTTWETRGTWETRDTRETRSTRRAGTGPGTDAGERTSPLEDRLIDASAGRLPHGLPPVFCEDDLLRVELPRPKQALIVISMSDRTALGLDQAPATLHAPTGDTPLPGPIAWQIAHDVRMSTWLGLYTDPATGIAADISRTYRQPPRMRTFVKLRDGLHSRLPGSTTRRIELDHIAPYNHAQPERGGQTTASDLACEGLREHHLKTDRVLTITGDANSVLTYTTHTGHRYPSWPELWHDPPGYTELALSTRTRPGPPPDDPDPPPF
jgi:hypothetical protein